MFRFTSKKVEDEKLKTLYQQHNVRIPDKQLYGEEYLRSCFNTNERTQSTQRPTTNSTKVNSKKFDMIRAQSSDKNQRKQVLQSNKSINTPAIENIELGNSFLEQRFNPKQQKSSGTYNFPNQKKQKSYYIIPSSKAGLMDIFEKYKDYTPKEQTAFKTQTQRATPQRPVRHFKALSQHLSQTINGSDKKPLNYYEQEYPQDLFGNQKLNQSTSFHSKTATTNLENSQLFQNMNNSFAHASPSHQMNKSFVTEKNVNNHVSKDNIFTATTYNQQMNEAKYKQTHNSCFRGISREKLTNQSFFVTNQNNPGPGEYEKKSQFQQAKRMNIFNRNENQDRNIISHSINKLKKRIQEAVNSNDIKIQQNQQSNNKITYESLKPNNPSHMFITDQRDRFGENQYINFFSNKNPMYSPGPGQYQQVHNTIYNQQQRIEKVKDQRKMLKEWLNPKKQLQQEESQQQLNNEEIYTAEPLCVYQFSYN